MDDLIRQVAGALEIHVGRLGNPRQAARDAIAAILRSAGRRQDDPLRAAFRAGFAAAQYHHRGASTRYADRSYDQWQQNRDLPSGQHHGRLVP